MQPSRLNKNTRVTQHIKVEKPTTGNNCKYKHLGKCKHGSSANKLVMLELFLHTASNIWWKKERQSQMALLSLGNRFCKKKPLCLYGFLEIGTRREKHLQCISDSLPVKHQNICIFTGSPQCNCRGECRPRAELMSTGSAEATQHFQVEQILKFRYGSYLKFPFVSYLMVSVQSSL